MAMGRPTEKWQEELFVTPSEARRVNQPFHCALQWRLQVEGFDALTEELRN